MSFARCAAFVASVTLILAPAVGRAEGGLSVSPISLEFDASGAARALEVSNPGDAPVDVQVRLFAWSAEGGQDHASPSTDIAFSPPMFRLAKGATQVVRLAVQVPAAEREQAYRLYVDQLPGAAEPGRLQMPVRMVLPLFVEPPARAGAAAPLRWRATFDAAHKRVHLVAVNDGRRRVRLTNLVYEQGGQTHPIAPGLAGYVLAGSERAWDFDYTGPSGALELKASTDQGAIVAQTPLAAG